MYCFVFSTIALLFRDGRWVVAGCGEAKDESARDVTNASICLNLL